MGCTASKLDNEDTVRRCKERRRLMKEAVYSRHHLAAAHSDYCRSLRLTGSALLTFSSGEPLPVSGHTPAVLLRPTSTLRSPSPAPPVFTPKAPTPPVSVRRSPAPAPVTRRKKMPKVPHILSDSSFTNSPPAPVTVGRKLPKVPHILSDSSFTNSPPHLDKSRFTYDARRNVNNSTYSDTASQASSVWNWDNFYPPPSPPDSVYFEQMNKENVRKDGIVESSDDEDEYSDEDKGSSFSKNRGEYGNPFGEKNKTQKGFDEISSFSRKSEGSFRAKKGTGLKKWESEEEEETEREEVHCSEWGDHDRYSTSSSSGDEGDLDTKSRSDYGVRSNFESVRKESGGNMGKVDSSFKTFSQSEKVSLEEDEKSSVSWGNRNDEASNSEMRMVVRHKDLAEIVAALREYFDKAASAGEQVSEMLETGRAQLDRSFKQLRKTVYHSSGMLSNLSSSWTSKPPLAVKYRYEPSPIEQTGGSKSLSSTLERLFAWEKKLYQEVKAREGVKIEHEKKLSALQSQEYRGENDPKLDKTKASINRLQSLISVTSQAVSTTSSAIVGLRDSDLVPQLVELCHGFMYMWKSMNQYHEIQNDIVQQVRGLINSVAKGESTSDLHRQATRDLESAVTSWHSSFCRLIKFQRDFVCSLHGWFKLTLLPVHAEPTNGKPERSEVFSFCDEWKLALDRIPDTVASEAIKSFINVVHAISLKQSEELKIKKRTETVSKELEKKASSLRNIEKKYYQSYSMVGIGVPDNGPDSGHLLDARDPLSEKKAELSTCQRRVEDEMLKHAKAVEVTRAMTLNNIQTGLPGVFQAMTSFSTLITEALETVCTRSYSI